MKINKVKEDFPETILEKPIAEQLDDNIDRPERHSIGGSMNRPLRSIDPLSPRNVEHQHKLDENHIRNILNEREARYGDFKDHAKLCQALKKTMQSGLSWNDCSPSQRQALETIADKIARILNGDPYYDDNWIDIIGYSQLILDQLHNNDKLQDL